MRLKRAKPNRSERSRHWGQRAVTATPPKRQWDFCGAQISSSIIGNFSFPWRCHHSSPVTTTAPAQLLLDLSRLLRHLLCLAARLHPKPILLSPSHHTPTALQVAPFSKDVRCQTFGRCFRACQVSPSRRHLGPRLALPRERENLMRTDIIAPCRQSQME